MVNHALFSLFLLLPPLVAFLFLPSFLFASVISFFMGNKTKKNTFVWFLFHSNGCKFYFFSDRYKLKISVIAVSQSYVQLVSKHEICKGRQAGRQAGRQKKRNSRIFRVNKNTKLYSRSFNKVIFLWIIQKHFCCDAGVAMYFNIDICVRPSIRLVRGSNFCIVHCHKGTLYQKSIKKTFIFL